MTEFKKPYAKFAFYFDAEDGSEPFPQFNCFDQQLDGGTVGLETLEWKRIPIPPFPTYEKWLKDKEKK